MFMAKLLGSEMASNLQPQTGQQMDLDHGLLFEQASALVKGLHTSQSSPPYVFKTLDPALNKSKAISTNPRLLRLASSVDGMENSRLYDLLRHILGNPNMSDCDLKKLCDSYFRDANFTADIRSCSMLEGLHCTLVFQYGELYQVDVTKFSITNVERQPLQHDTDGYDCGLFVIKFMQGFNYPSGVHRMDDTERPRLLMELCGDDNNRDALEVMKKFQAWKAEKGNISESSSDISDSEINEYKDKSYEELKKGNYRVKNRDGSLRCPFCLGKKKQQFKYRDLLQHAPRVGSGAVWRKAKT
ncbi:hypothetical protein RHSIM_Rhsim06G0089800 [Rhododendron simsii]|uniref:Zinc finger-XS domain-containing protein n=1 Tax=Rhododendron simsii TaxID=118357 RepID=A0A834GWH8_RHOSS|nr:hypothetical protein RHSIM_Rhsim06G0089800 [Rhododendron simsii]